MRFYILKESTFLASLSRVSLLFTGLELDQDLFALPIYGKDKGQRSRHQLELRR
jgi:hypothetical protein